MVWNHLVAIVFIQIQIGGYMQVILNSFLPLIQSIWNSTTKLKSGKPQGTRIRNRLYKNCFLKLHARFCRRCLLTPQSPAPPFPTKTKHQKTTQSSAPFSLFPPQTTSNNGFSVFFPPKPLSSKSQSFNNVLGAFAKSLASSPPSGASPVPPAAAAWQSRRGLPRRSKSSANQAFVGFRASQNHHLW